MNKICCVCEKPTARLVRNMCPTHYKRVLIKENPEYARRQIQASAKSHLKNPEYRAEIVAKVRKTHLAKLKIKRKTDKNYFILETYRNMIQRCCNAKNPAAYLYFGKTVLPKSDFISYTINNPQFHAVFEQWVVSGYEFRLTPSINRINPLLGYTLDNIEWISFSANSTAANTTRWKRSTGKRLSSEKQIAIGVILK